MSKPICVRLPNWVGDACMALPALYRLREASYPLILVGRPWARDLLAGLEPAQFIAIEGPLREDIARVRGALGGVRHDGVCFPDSLSSAALFRLAGVRTGGYRDDGRSLLLKWPVRKPAGRVHAVESYFHLAEAVLAAWGVSSTGGPGPDLRLPVTSGHVDTARTMLSRAGLMASRFVLLSPTATGLHRGRVKSWPHYEALAQHLRARGFTVAVCPPPNEVDVARANAPSAQILPSLPLGAYAALTREAALVVCNDSGTSHVAAAAGAPQLTLFGVTQPWRTRPWSPTAHWIGDDTGWPDLDTVVKRVDTLLDRAPANALA